MDLRPRLLAPIAELQRTLNLSSYASLWMVLAGQKRCSPTLAIKIESATDGAITRSDLRPDLWPPVHTNTSDPELGATA